LVRLAVPDTPRSKGLRLYKKFSPSLFVSSGILLTIFKNLVSDVIIKDER